MLYNLFYQILKMSIFASAAVIIILGLRLVLSRKLPKYFCHILWIFVLLRLLLPVSYSSVLSIFNIIPVSETSINNTVNYQTEKYSLPEAKETENPAASINLSDATGQESAVNSVSEPVSENAPIQKFQLKNAVPFIWIAGFFSLLMFSVYSYISVWFKLKEAVLYQKIAVNDFKMNLKIKRNNRVFVSDKVNTPIVFGFYKPKIILPENTAKNSGESEIRYIITHELVHIKRFDYIVKLLWVISLCIYWFNPVIWIGFIMAQKDMEMSCDEKVLSISSEDIRSEYASSLINLAAKQNTLLNGGLLAFGESSIKNRVKRIMKFKKPGFIIGIISIIILAIVGFSLLTDGNKKEEVPDSSKDVVQNNASEFDVAKIQDYSLETVIIENCTAEVSPFKSDKPAAWLKYGDIIFVTGKYNDWLRVSTNDLSTKYWINSKYVISESKHTEYNLGIITKDKVTVGTVPLVKGNLIQVLIKDKDKSCVTIRDIDVNSGKTGWIDNSSYTMAKEGISHNQAYLKKNAMIYEKPSLTSNKVDIFDYDLFVNIKEEKSGWVKISSYGPVSGWALKSNIYLPSAAAGISTNVISSLVLDNFKPELLKSVQELDKSSPVMGPWRIIYYDNNRVIIYIDSHICAINLDKNVKGIYSVIDLRNLKIAGSQGSKIAVMYPSPDGTALVLGTGVYDTDSESIESLYACNLYDGSVKELEKNYNLADNKIVWYRDMLSSNSMAWGVLIQGKEKKIYYDFIKKEKVGSFSERYSETAVKKAEYTEDSPKTDTDYEYINWYKIDNDNIIGAPFKTGASSSSDLKLSDFRIVKINLKTKNEEVLFKIN